MCTLYMHKQGTTKVCKSDTLFKDKSVILYRLTVVFIPLDLFICVGDFDSD